METLCIYRIDTVVAKDFQSNSIYVLQFSFLCFTRYLLLLSHGSLLIG